MPVMDQLAPDGVFLNRFHTTALCSPSRTALLTGHNHHANNAGAIMELATAFPGNTGIRPQTITPVAEILRQNGYDRGLRQIPRNPALGGLRLRAVRPLAHPPASTNSTASSAARPTSGRPPSTTA
jgi:hypothetical protein